MRQKLSLHKKLIVLAWRNVLRNWRHSLATLLAIASGFMAISLFEGFIKELRFRTEDSYSTRGMIGHVVIQHLGAQDHLDEDTWKYSLNAKEQNFLDEFLAHDPDFSRRVRYLSIAGLANSGSKNAVFMGLGYDIQDGYHIRGQRWAWNTTAGLPLHLATEPSALMGGGLGTLLGCQKRAETKFINSDGTYVPAERPFSCRHNRIMLSSTTESAQVNAIDLKILGLVDGGFRESDKRLVHISLADAQRLLDTDKITMMSVQLRDFKATPTFIARLKKAAHAAGVELEVTPWLDHKLASYVRSGLEILGVFKNLFMTIVITIGVMSVANTMMKSVNERTREIGTLRSFGFRRGQLVFMFACEGFFISAIACAIGLVCTIALAKLIGILGITYKAGALSTPIQLEIAFAPAAWLLSAGVLSGLASLTASLCARKASRLLIAEALRHV